jgi:hypothetical protein
VADPETQSRWQWFMERAIPALGAAPRNAARVMPIFAPSILAADWLNGPVRAAPAAPAATAPTTPAAPGGFGAALAAAMPATAPTAPAASANPLSIMLGITAQAESGNRERNADGTLVTSPAGAQGRMQVMPKTNLDPGFGVRPATNDSDAERTRVGQDYLAAMMRRYGNDPAKAWAAYNWGPGNLDNALTRHGNNWLQHAPGETQAYVTNNVRQLGTASAGPGGALFSAPTPTEVMSFIPDPVRAANVNLPDAPMLEAPADMPQQEVVNADLLLAGLRAASQVPERDRKGDNWERIQALLGGMAAGISGANAGTGFGAALAMAGAGGNAAFSAERDSQRAQDTEIQQMQQQLNIALERAGVDINMTALGQRNANLDRAWTSTDNQRQTRNENATRTDTRAVEELLTNAGIDQNYIASLNAARQGRGQIGAQALGGQYDAQNQGTAAALAAGNRANADPLATVDATLTRLGVVPTTQTRAAGVAMAGGNPQGALPYLAEEVLMSGLYSAYLGEDVAKKVQEYLRDDSTKPMALALVQQALSEDYAAPAGSDANKDMQTLIETLAARGQPVARVVRGR